jgi:hypothetical protein
VKTFIWLRRLVPAVPLLLLLLPAAPVTATPAVYRCEANGVTVYSDRPCAHGAQVHEIDTSRITVYEAEQAAQGPDSRRPDKKPPGKESARKSKSRARAAPDADKHRADCDKLDASLRDIRTKMRTGYGIKEGERLKARYRDLTGRRRALKCR